MTGAFTWSPRTSLGVELSVFFDSFSLERKYPGALGWINFLQKLDNGKLELLPSAFPDRRQELERCGIHSIVAHFEIEDSQRSGEIDADLPEIPKQLFPTPIYGDEKDGR